MLFPREDLFEEFLVQLRNRRHIVLVYTHKGLFEEDLTVVEQVVVDVSIRSEAPIRSLGSTDFFSSSGPLSLSPIFEALPPGIC